jgi:polysaccharide biosynthesis/export protein
MFSAMFKKCYIYCILIIAISFSFFSCTTSTYESDKEKKMPQVEEVPQVGVLTLEEQVAELKLLHEAPTKPYVIVPGDRFYIKVYDSPELNTGWNTPGNLVLPDGTISYDLIGIVKIGGMTIKDATNLLIDKMKKYIKFPIVALIPRDITGSNFSISGFITVPGVYQLQNDFKITDAIAQAGGMRTGIRDDNTIILADLAHSFIIRDGNLLPVDFLKAVGEGDALNNIPLRHGDYIYVPSSLNQEVYIMGQVEMQGYQPYEPNMTLVKAISKAEGRLLDGSDTVIVVRGKLINPKVYKVDYEDILRGHTFDFRLQPNDIVYVPRTGFDQYNWVIEHIMPTFELINLMLGPLSGVNLSLPTFGPAL